MTSNSILSVSIRNLCAWIVLGHAALSPEAAFTLISPFPEAESDQNERFWFVCYSVFITHK